MQLNELKINQRYNLRFYGTAHLGAELTRATLLAQTSLMMASATDPGLMSKHIAVLPSLPDGTPKDAAALTYLVFETESGSRVAYAYNWIIPTSIEASNVNIASLRVRIASADDLPRISAVLANAGFMVESSTLS